MNILYLIIQLLMMILIYKIYFIFNVEFLNLFSEIKNFLLQKINLNLNANFMETTISKHDQQFNSDNIEIKEYNKKEKILIITGCIVIFFCMYIFFKNNVQSVEILIEQIPQEVSIIQQVQVPIYQNLDFIQNVLQNSWDLSPSFRNSILKNDFINYNAIYGNLRMEIAEALLTKYIDIDFPQPFDDAQKLIELFKPEINNFILSKRNT